MATPNLTALVLMVALWRPWLFLEEGMFAVLCVGGRQVECPPHLSQALLSHFKVPVNLLEMRETSKKLIPCSWTPRNASLS